jgi:hypothetical protein
MQTHTKHALQSETNRRVPFLNPVLWICNNIRFLRKAWYYVLLAGYLYSYMTNSRLHTNRSFITCTFNYQVSNEKNSKVTFEYKWKFSYSRSVQCIIMSIWYINCYWNAVCRAVIFWTRKSLQKRCCDIKRMFKWNSSFICNKTI